MDGPGPFTRSTTRARDGAHDAIESMIGRLETASDRMARSAHKLVDKVGIATSDAADAVVRKRGQLAGAPSRMAEYCRTGVRKHPVKSIGIAALAGAALYGALRLRQSRRLSAPQ